MNKILLSKVSFCPIQIPTLSFNFLIRETLKIKHKNCLAIICCFVLFFISQKNLIEQNILNFEN